ncbi:hypothetical protein L345_12029, partial [Ophiophagus hannah]
MWFTRYCQPQTVGAVSPSAVRTHAWQRHTRRLLQKPRGRPPSAASAHVCFLPPAFFFWWGVGNPSPRRRNCSSFRTLRGRPALFLERPRAVGKGRTLARRRMRAGKVKGDEAPDNEDYYSLLNEIRPPPGIRSEAIRDREALGRAPWEARPVIDRTEAGGDFELRSSRFWRFSRRGGAQKALWEDPLEHCPVLRLLLPHWVSESLQLLTRSFLVDLARQAVAKEDHVTLGHSNESAAKPDLRLGSSPVLNWPEGKIKSERH